MLRILRGFEYEIPKDKQKAFLENEYAEYLDISRYVSATASIILITIAIIMGITSLVQDNLYWCTMASVYGGGGLLFAALWLLSYKTFSSGKRNGIYGILDYLLTGATLCVPMLAFLLGRGGLVEAGAAYLGTLGMLFQRRLKVWMLVLVMAMLLAGMVATSRMPMEDTVITALNLAGFMIVGMALNQARARLRVENYIDKSIIVAQNVELVKLNEMLSKASETDYLTGLANRRKADIVFTQEWNRCMREKQPLSVIFIDADRFKNFNDYYGHLAGDEMLIKYASIIKDKVKRATDVAGRFGGDEFIIIMPNTPSEGAVQVGDSILHAIRKLRDDWKQARGFDMGSISLGVVSIVPESHMQENLLFKLGDSACYRSKSNGGDTLTVYGQQECAEMDVESGIQLKFF